MTYFSYPSGWSEFDLTVVGELVDGIPRIEQIWAYLPDINGNYIQVGIVELLNADQLDEVLDDYHRAYTKGSVTFTDPRPAYDPY